MDYWLIGIIAYTLGGMMGALGVAVMRGSDRIAMLDENQRLKRRIAELEKQRDRLSPDPQLGHKPHRAQQFND